MIFLTNLSYLFDIYLKQHFRVMDSKRTSSSFGMHCSVFVKIMSVDFATIIIINSLHQFNPIHSDRSLDTQVLSTLNIIICSGLINCSLSLELIRQRSFGDVFMKFPFLRYQFIFYTKCINPRAKPKPTLVCAYTFFIFCGLNLCRFLFCLCHCLLYPQEF